LAQQVDPDDRIESTDRVVDVGLLADVQHLLGPCSEQDVVAVTELIDRKPKSAFSVIVRRGDGVPVVTKNAPFERDGTPMPTLFWLLPSAMANDAIGRLEASGGVRAVERELGFDVLDAIHQRYADERNALIPEGWLGPRPSGGVGGTRRGCKCLHAHYAYFLSGAVDEVGAWVEAQLDARDRDQRVIRLN
jgi:uncharacterized protein